MANPTMHNMSFVLNQDSLTLTSRVRVATRTGNMTHRRAASDFCTNCVELRRDCPRAFYQCRGHSEADINVQRPMLVPPRSQAHEKAILLSAVHLLQKGYICKAEKVAAKCPAVAMLLEGRYDRPGRAGAVVMVGDCLESE